MTDLFASSEPMEAREASPSCLRMGFSLSGHPAIEASDSLEDRLPQTLAMELTAAPAWTDALLRAARYDFPKLGPPSIEWWRAFARRHLGTLCHRPGLDEALEVPLDPPSAEDLMSICESAPPMFGSEYLSHEALAELWTAFDLFIRNAVAASGKGAGEFFRRVDPAFNLLGRVTFHLAENKKEGARPFAFMATYTGKVSMDSKPQYTPIGKALVEYAGAKNHAALVSLLTPVDIASKKSAVIREMLESGAIYQPQAWTPAQAYKFLKDAPVFEESGLLVRLPNTWLKGKASKPVAQVVLGAKPKSKLGADALLDFKVRLSLDGEELGEEDLHEILNSAERFVRIKGKWVEIDPEQLQKALDFWKEMADENPDGIPFADAMRMLSGVGMEAKENITEEMARQGWADFVAGDWLSQALAELRNPTGKTEIDEKSLGLKAELRPYQKNGVHWLLFMNQLGIGSCLADDMGLGKTMQLLAMLLTIKKQKANAKALIVAPASLLGNWKAEILRFAPSLRHTIIHSSEKDSTSPDAVKNCDIALTSYGMASRLEWLPTITWDILAIDEAQAIKNPSTKQTKSVKNLKARHRVAMTGTPVENHVGDLWSIFDFMNPGLLGTAAKFAKYSKRVAADGGPDAYRPLRSLTRPYILRRLKTDRSIISDLPDKTELNAYCALSKKQATLYAQTVEKLRENLESSNGIQRKGLVLAALTHFKQICDHPALHLGDYDWQASHSGKFGRLSELCETISEKREKTLIFTQFQEMTEPLARHLETLFNRSGLILHGGTPVKERPKLVEAFQRDGGPPFFVITVKAGGTGLNLTAASHVIHFDRWWNPAVENQATDRAFRIGQKKNVLVHKFICKGTMEEKIDDLINKKKNISESLLGEGGERLLTEMSNDELLNFVRLDLDKAGLE